MVYWLLQSQDAHPSIPRGQAPGELLTPDERHELAQYTSLARRRDWLLGRWTAKHLLQQIAAQQNGCDIPLPAIGIRPAADGAPVTDFRQPLNGKPFSISLSHSDGYALCAALPGRDVPLGVDLEWIVPHDTGFAESYLSPEENKLVDPRLRRLYHLHLNAIWSAKEATLKALRPRARIDLRRLHCLIQPIFVEPQTWIPFQIRFPEELAAQHVAEHLAGWWQTLGGFVLTIVAPVDGREPDKLE